MKTHETNIKQLKRVLTNITIPSNKSTIHIKQLKNILASIRVESSNKSTIHIKQLKNILASIRVANKGESQIKRLNNVLSDISVVRTSNNPNKNNISFNQLLHNIRIYKKSNNLERNERAGLHNILRQVQVLQKAKSHSLREILQQIIRLKNKPQNEQSSELGKLIRNLQVLKNVAPSGGGQNKVHNITNILTNITVNNSYSINQIFEKAKKIIDKL